MVRLFLLVAGVTTEGAGRGELAQLVTYHVLGDVNRNEFITIVHCESMADKLGGNH